MLTDPILDSGRATGVRVRTLLLDPPRPVSAARLLDRRVLQSIGGNQTWAALQRSYQHPRESYEFR
jgi:hypothetical protein